MKKIIVAVLLLIPIVVLLTISASGLLIASAFVDIPAESILIKHGGNEIKNEEIILEEQDPNRKYTVFCEVFPGIATDEMEWRSSNPEIAKIVPSESRKDAADIEFLDYGSVDITCTSKKNTSITARTTFYVTGKVPGYLLIGDYTGSHFDTLEMQRCQVTNLLAQVKPAVSVREAKVHWSSSNEDVAKVDNNGVVEAIAEGEAVIRATVTASDVTVWNELTVKVIGTALVRKKTVYTTSNNVNVTEYLNEPDSTVEGGAYVNLSDLPSFGTKVLTVSKGDHSEEITFVKVDTYDTIAIENLHILKKGALSTFLALGTSNIELKALPLNGETPDVRWISTDHSVVTVDNGRLYAVGSGSAEVYAEADGYVSEHVTINVTSTVEDFRLSETEYQDKVGLLQERVFGNVTYRNKKYTREYPITVQSYPENVNIESYTFESTNEEIARVDKKGVVTFAEDVEGKTVTITATAYNQAGLPVRRSYTFHLVNGVNVGVGVGRAHFDVSKGEMPSFDPYWDLVDVAGNKDVSAIILHTDVYYPSKSAGGKSILNCRASIFGNGNKLDGQFYMEAVEDDEMLLLWNFDKFTDMPASMDISLVNLNLQATQPTTENSKETFEELNRTGGGAVSLKGNYPSASNKMKLTMKGCLLQYAYSHVNVAIGEVFIDGCILRNNSASAIVLQQSSYCKASLKLKNCIFSHTIAPVSIACGNFEEVKARFNGEETGELQYGNFELEGQIYVYNWKKLEEVQMSILPQNLKDDVGNSLVIGVNNFLADVIKEAFKMSSLENLYVDEEGTEWLNFSFLMLGIWADMNPQFNGNTLKEDGNTNGIDVRYTPNYFDYAEVCAYYAPSIKLATLIKTIINLEEYKTYHIFCKDGDGGWNTSPGENYEINDVTRARLRGEHS